MDNYNDFVAAWGSLIAAIGALLAATFAVLSFLKLREQVYLQQRQLNGYQLEAEIRLFQAITEVSDPVYASRAKYLIDKKILALARLQDDDDSITKLGPRVVLVERYKPRAISKHEMNWLHAENILILHIDDAELQNHLFDKFAKTIFNNCSGEVARYRSEYRANIQPEESLNGKLGSFELFVDRKRLLDLSAQDSYEDWFQFNDYPTGKVLKQFYRITKLQENDDEITVSLDLSNEIVVNNDAERSFLLKDELVHSLNADGFPDLRGRYNPAG